MFAWEYDCWRANPLMERNVEMVMWAVLGNSCPGEVRGCLTAKHLLAAALTRGPAWHQEQDTPENCRSQFVQPVLGNLARFKWPNPRCGHSQDLGQSRSTDLEQIPPLSLFSHPGEVWEGSMQCGGSPPCKPTSRGHGGGVLSLSTSRCLWQL